MQTGKLFAACAALALAACGSGSDGHQVTMSVAVNSGNANALSTAVTTTSSADGLTLSDGTNTLVITTAEVVLRDIELKRSDLTECHASTTTTTQALTASDGADDAADHDAGDEHDGDAVHDDDSCEKVSTGARLVTLPLDGSVSQQLTATVPAGTYDRVEFEIHKLSDDNGSDILRQRPDLEDVSVRVIGTYNGAPFVFVSDKSFEQRVELDPAVVVDDTTSAINVTLAIDLGAWFATDGGTLIDPTSDGDTVEDGIDEGSFACFEDDNHNGHHDGDDDGEDHDVGDDNGADGNDAGDDNGSDASGGDNHSGSDHPED